MKTIASLFLALCLTCGTVCQCMLNQCHEDCTQHVEENRPPISPRCVGGDDPDW